jgi:hypothetical protein
MFFVAFQNYELLQNENNLRQAHTQVPQYDGHNCNDLWLRIVTAKSSHNAAGFRKLQCLVLDSSSFFTFCDGQLLYYKNRHIVTVTNEFVTR